MDKPDDNSTCGGRDGGIDTGMRGDLSDCVAVTANPWQSLRRFTAARIALGRSGVSQPTAPQLAFQLAHARARDAVHAELDQRALADALSAACGLPCVHLHSAAGNRHVYLQRPDLGRTLDDVSRQTLAGLAALPAKATSG